VKRFYEDILDAFGRYAKIAVATVVNASGSTPRGVGAKMMIFPDGSYRYSVGGGKFESLVIQDALQVLETGNPSVKTYSFNPEGQYAIGAVCGGKAEVLIEMITNSPDLFVVGGGHVGQALIRAVSALDFNVTLIDDRLEFAQLRESNPKIKLIHTPPDYSGIPEATPDTYICIVTKGYITDEAALRQVIKGPAKYIGMIGSRKKIQTVYANLERDGFDRSLFARIHAPIGDDINADSSEEIAISILAEIIRFKNGKP
jgi:xanthine dehydrogenase accessory factor